MCCEREGGVERMVPGLVLLGSEIVSTMEDVAVDNVCQHLLWSASPSIRLF